MTVDVEKILLTDTREGRLGGRCCELPFLYDAGVRRGEIRFLLSASNMRDTFLLEAAAACIAEYNQRVQECPF